MEFSLISIVWIDWTDCNRSFVFFYFNLICSYEFIFLKLNWKKSNNYVETKFERQMYLKLFNFFITLIYYLFKLINTSSKRMFFIFRWNIKIHEYQNVYAKLISWALLLETWALFIWSANNNWIFPLRT